MAFLSHFNYFLRRRNFYFKKNHHTFEILNQNKFNQQHMNRIYFSFLVASVFLFGCKNDKSSQLEGEWKVQWITDPASYPDVDASMNFTMNGKFTFRTNGKLSIDAYGYENCIFSNDTLNHSLNWELKNDSLNTYNDKDMHGISYRVTEMSDSKVKLQMMEDIYLHLTRD